MKTIKQRYKRFRYQCSWKYPRLYELARKAKFPAQLLLLCVALMSAVQFYQRNFSFDASMRANAVTTDRPITSPTDTASTSDTANLLPQAEIKTASFNPAEETAAPRVKSQVANAEAALTPSRPETLEAQTSATTNSANLKTIAQDKEEALLDQVLKAEALLQRKQKQTALLEAKVRKARNLLNTSETGKNALDVYSTTWLQQQPASNYVVQIAASTDNKLLADYAHNNPINGPLAIYPFKVNKSGEVVYGLSTGLFNAWGDAMNEVPKLSEVSKRHGVWVRKVSEITTQFASLKEKDVLR